MKGGDPSQYWATVVQVCLVFGAAIVVEARYSAVRTPYESRAARWFQGIIMALGAIGLLVVFNFAIGFLAGGVRPGIITQSIVDTFLVMCATALLLNPVLFVASGRNADLFVVVRRLWPWSAFWRTRRRVGRMLWRARGNVRFYDRSIVFCERAVVAVRALLPELRGLRGRAITAADERRMLALVDGMLGVRPFRQLRAAVVRRFRRRVEGPSLEELIGQAELAGIGGLRMIVLARRSKARSQKNIGEMVEFRKQFTILRPTTWEAENAARLAELTAAAARDRLSLPELPSAD